jgi:hypothetical protein
MLRIEVPPLMKNILKEINKAVLKQQSAFIEPDRVMTREEIVDFLAVYLNTMARLRDSTGEVGPSPFYVTYLTLSLFSGYYTILRYISHIVTVQLLL